MQSLVDAGRHEEAKTAAESLSANLKKEATKDKEDLKKATVADDWEKVTRLSRELGINKRQQAIVDFIAEKVTDPKLPPTDQREAATVALESYSVLEVDPISVFDHLNAAGFRLKRSSDPTEASDPALFGLSQDFEKGSDTEFTADFLLSWSPQDRKGAGRRPGITPGEEVLFAASVEGHLNSLNDEAADSWKFRLTRNSIYDFGNENSGPDTLQLHLNLSGKLESDRDFERQRLSGELELSPTYLAWGIGMYQPTRGWLIAGKKPEAAPPVEFRWLPTLGLDGGDIIEGPSKPEDSTFWLSGKLKVELRLNFLSTALDVESVELFAEGKALYSVDEGEWHSYLETGLDMMFSKNVGWTVLYKVGENTPDFVDANLLTTGITVKF
jgi:hypothetical protein